MQAGVHVCLGCIEGSMKPGIYKYQTLILSGVQKKYITKKKKIKKKEQQQKTEAEIFMRYF